MQGYLYVLENEGWLKVGRAVDLENKLSNYNYVSPTNKHSFTYTSELLYDVEEAEKILLNYLKDMKTLQQRKVEWFKKVGRTQESSRLKSLVRIITGKIEEITDTYYENEDKEEGGIEI